MAAALFAGCGKQSEEAEGSGGSSTALDESKIAVIAVYDDLIKDWDPAISYGNDGRFFFNTYETLLRSNPDGTYENVLATDYSSSEDGLEWTFTLREGVKYHDGTDFNADAVKYVVDRTKALGQGGSFIWDAVDNVEVVDDYTVKFHLSYPCDLREVVACQYAAYMYAPSAGDDPEESSKWFYECNICGTGPYMLDDYSVGSYITLKKFDDYWNGWDGDHLDKVIMQLVAESTTRRQMIEGGEADVAEYLNASDAEAMAGEEGFSIEVTSAAKNLQLYFNTLSGPLMDQKVRQALAYSFPYEDVIDYVKFGKYADYPKDVVAPAALNGTTDSIPYSYDMDKAGELLEEAGVADGFEITASYQNANEETKKVLELWKSELAKLNITLNIETNSWEVVYNRAKSPDPADRADIFAVECFADTSAAYCLYSSSATSEGAWNFSGYSDPEIDAAVEEAYKEGAFDAEKSYEMMSAAGEKMAEACFMMNCFDMNNVTAVADDFQGFELNPYYDNVLLLYNCWKTAD